MQLLGRGSTRLLCVVSPTYREKRCTTITSFALVLLIAAAIPLIGQTVSGTITGTVTDPSGAVVPGVTVKVENIDTSQIRTTTSNSAGIFSIPALPPGSYTVDATMHGFQETTAAATLAVGQTLNVDLHMQIGSTSQKIEVVANESLGLQTQSHELTSEMDAKTVEDLPEYSGYRNAAFYAQTTQVGVQPGSQLGDNNIGSNVSQYNMQSNQLFIAGQGFWSTSYLLDGVVDMSYFDQTATVQTPSEATQQVEIIRSSANACYDGANAVNALTKSGTNTFHGRAYEYLENDAFNARGYNAGSLNELRYNMFGANGVSFQSDAAAHAAVAGIVKTAHKNGLRIGVTLLGGGAGAAGTAVAADEQTAIADGEVTLDAQGSGTVTASVELRAVKATSTELLRAYIFRKTGPGEYDPATLSDVTGKVKSTSPEPGMLTVTLKLGPH